MTGYFFYTTVVVIQGSTIACIIQYISGTNDARYTTKPYINYICCWHRNQQP